MRDVVLLYCHALVHLVAVGAILWCLIIANAQKAWKPQRNALVRIALKKKENSESEQAETSFATAYQAHGGPVRWGDGKVRSEHFPNLHRFEPDLRLHCATMMSNTARRATYERNHPYRKRRTRSRSGACR